MTTKIKDGAIPISQTVLDAAHITEDTPLDVKSIGEGRLVIEAVDSIEKVVDEYADRVLTEEQFDSSLERISSITAANE